MVVVLCTRRVKRMTDCLVMLGLTQSTTPLKSFESHEQYWHKRIKLLETLYVYYNDLQPECWIFQRKTTLFSMNFGSIFQSRHPALCESNRMPQWPFRVWKVPFCEKQRRVKKTINFLSFFPKGKPGGAQQQITTCFEFAQGHRIHLLHYKGQSRLIHSFIGFCKY